MEATRQEKKENPAPIRISLLMIQSDLPLPPPIAQIQSYHITYISYIHITYHHHYHPPLP